MLAKVGRVTWLAIDGRNGMSQGLETAFAMDAASIKFGFGVTGELGFEMKRLGVKSGDGVD